jgi:type IV secretory pathway VirB2 component (pilin)
VSALIASLGSKLAERWLTALLLPGVVFVAVTAVAVRLGHRNWARYELLTTAVDGFAASPAARSTGATLLLAVAAVAAAVAASAAAQGLGQAVVRVWTGPWGRLGRPLVRRHRRRRQRAAARYEQALLAKARAIRAHPPVPPEELPDTAALAAARDRIALTEPALPTWMGNRMLAAGERIRRAYDVDLATAWPHLWLVVPEESRQAVGQAQAEFAAAARTAAWGLMYLVVGVWWWPAAVIGVAVIGYGWWQGRRGVDRLAQLVESLVDLNLRTLAATLGVAVDGPFTAADGAAVSRILHKQS